MRDAIHLTRLSESTIRRRAKDGDIPVDEVARPRLYGIAECLLAARSAAGGLETVTDGHVDVHGGQDRQDRHTGGPDRRAEMYDGQLVASLEADKAQLRAQVNDLTSRITRLDDDKVHLREEASLRETEWKTRVSTLEQAAAAREVHMDRLAKQVSVLEAKVREILEEGKSDNLQLANRIADLVQQHADIHTRVLELEPVAAEVPMLQAAVEDTKAELTEREQALLQRERQLADINEDIETIASRPVAGPVFRLLIKGKLRI
jgi:hypothetical protein